MGRRLHASLTSLWTAAALAAGLAPDHAQAAPTPVWTLEARDTAEAWRNLQGGLSVGDAALNKLQASLRFTGDGVGWRGFSAYAQVFATSSGSLSQTRTGDTQTASNIEAPHVERLFELWAAQDFGEQDKPGWVSLRAGLIDLNRTFDSVSPAGLFINSSHGIGPDLSHSGRVDPSIFPISGLAAQVDWRPSRRLTTHLGVFAEPDPARIHNFVDLRLSSRDGVIVIGQADYDLGHDAQASVGVWRETAAEPSLADPTRMLRPHPGAYAFVQAPTPLPGKPSGWLRAGFADGRLQDVDGYLGAGLAWKGLVPGRADDRFGLAVAHARISGAARAAGGLPSAETSYEASYSFKLGRFLHLQPDVQHIVHPATAPGLRNATVVGLRLVAFVRTPDPPGDED